MNINHPQRNQRCKAAAKTIINTESHMFHITYHFNVSNSHLNKSPLTENPSQHHLMLHTIWKCHISFQCLSTKVRLTCFKAAFIISECHFGFVVCISFSSFFFLPTTYLFTHSPLYKWTLCFYIYMYVIYRYIYSYIVDIRQITVYYMFISHTQQKCLNCDKIRDTDVLCVY